MKFGIPLTRYAVVGHRGLLPLKVRENQRSRAAEVSDTERASSALNGNDPDKGLATLQRTAVAQRTSAVTPKVLSKEVTAQFGCEIEIPGIKVSAPAGTNPPVRGTVLFERQHWKMETDTAGPGQYNLEVVFNPLSSESEVNEAMAEVIDFFQAVRNKVQETGKTVISLKSVEPSTALDHELTVNDLRFGGRLQSTYGAKLGDVEGMMAELLPAVQMRTIRAKTKAVADLYALNHSGAVLEPSAKQLTMLINMYLLRAASQRDTGNGTAHTLFRLMLRTDFCSIYDNLLDSKSREAMRSMLTTDPGKSVPPFMKALHMENSDLPIFARAYKCFNGEPPEDKPTVKNWLQSIVDGRSDGELRKDLLSPPPGYPLHQETLEAGQKNYGMGAMGVGKHGEVIFEIRGAPYRPIEIPLNGQMARAVQTERRKAGLLNLKLGPVDAQPESSVEFVLLCKLEEHYSALQTIFERLASQKNSINPDTWQYLKIALDSYLTELPALRKEVQSVNLSTGVQALDTSISNVVKAGYELIQTGDATQDAQNPLAVWAALESFKRKLHEFEVQLWEAGK